MCGACVRARGIWESRRSVLGSRKKCEKMSGSGKFIKCEVREFNSKLIEVFNYHLRDNNICSWNDFTFFFFFAKIKNSEISDKL